MADAPPRITALIVAAGKGERAGSGIPKQFRSFRGKSVLGHAIDALAAHPAISDIRVVIGSGQEDLYKEAIGTRSLGFPIIGGATRQDSVRNGLETQAVEGAPDIVLIHDAARPLYTDCRYRSIDCRARKLSGCDPGPGSGR